MSTIRLIKQILQLKMKNATQIALLFFLVISCNTSKRIVATEESKQFEVTIDVPDKNANQIYTSVNEWMVLTFVNAESVIQFQDKESGKAMGKYVGDYKKPEFPSVPFKSIISVDVKDQKARIRFLEAQWMSTNKNGSEWKIVQFQETIDKIRAEWSDLASDLESHLIQKSDW
ncbi:MAG: DUF4468 domain-containing protein [Bacteroidota bacterium]